jgi:hypothetical protein
MAALLAPIEGAFEYVDGTLTQTAVGEPVEWRPPVGLSTPYAIVGSNSWSDYTVSTTASLLPASAASSTGAMVIARFRGYTGFGDISQFHGYALTVDSGGNWRIVRNSHSPLVLASGSVPPASTYHLALTVSGSTVSAVIGRARVATVDDTTYTEGPAGVGSLGYYPVRFRSFGVEKATVPTASRVTVGT